MVGTVLLEGAASAVLEEERGELAVFVVAVGWTTVVTADGRSVTTFDADADKRGGGGGGIEGSAF